MKPSKSRDFTRRQGTRMMMDLTRATQNIEWSGTLDLRGDKIDVGGCRGTRDRSWGIRQIGMAEPQAPVPPAPQQFYWLWTPSNFDEAAFFCHTMMMAKACRGTAKRCLMILPMVPHGNDAD